MENASKALMIAGGVLIALLTIGALVIMFNQIGDYGKSQNTNKKDTKIAEFNMDFERYLDDKGITGADVISLLNKVSDYNQKSHNVVNNSEDVEKSIDYSIEMTLVIDGLNNFNDKYAYSGSDRMFNNTSYTFNRGSDRTANRLKSDIKNAIAAENINGLTSDDMKNLSGIYDKNDRDIEKKIHEKLMEINKVKFEDWDKNKAPTLNTISKYKQYWEFKTSKFEQDGELGYAPNGQINMIKVKFVK